MSERGGRGGSSRGGPRGGGGGVRGAHNHTRGGGRGGTTGGRGGGHSGSGGGGGGGAGGAGGQPERKKEVILDLAKFVDKKIRVKFQGGREVQGVLKGYDQLMNLVMDEVTEYLPSDGQGSEQKTRQLGLAVLRGTAVTIINPAEGFEQIANPFTTE